MSLFVARNTKIGIIGAGFSALRAAYLLKKRGFGVKLIEKSGSPGGRMASRRMDTFSIDHGAQYFTARKKIFINQVKKWESQGFVKEWKGRIGEIKDDDFCFIDSNVKRFVGVPDMRSISCHLAKDLDISYDHAIVSAARRESLWTLESNKTSSTVDFLVISTPPQQALAFLPSSSRLSKTVGSVKLDPCWAVMLTFSRPTEIPFDAAFVSSSPISWIARNSSKPQRGSIESWIIHATPKWSSEFFDSPGNTVVEHLLRAFRKVTKNNSPAPDSTTSHRWRYSICNSPLNCGSLWDPDLKVGLCGDWCDSLRVEGAFMSGTHLAEKITKSCDTVI